MLSFTSLLRKNYKFYIKLLIIVLVIIFVVLKYQNGSWVENYRNSVGAIDDEGITKVLILSSMPRSGSTIFGTTVATFSPSSVYFSEPLYHLKSCFTNTESSFYIENLLNCRFDEDIKHILGVKNYNLVDIFNTKSKFCSDKVKVRNKSLNPHELKDKCQHSNLRVIKLIRTRISEIEPILANSHNNLKVIYLVRDPRGSIYSLQKFPNWNKEPEERCEHLLNDIADFHTLSERFPGKMIQISFENFSQRPWMISKAIFSFIYEKENVQTSEVNNSIPEEKFLPLETQIHLHMIQPNLYLKQKLLYNDIRETFQDWRRRISRKMIRKIEQNEKCREAILKLNYKLLKNSVNARNESIITFYDLKSLPFHR